MNTLRALLLATLPLLTLPAACGGGAADDEPFDTFQACYDDHHASYSAAQAIAICCLDHPIGGAAAGVACGADAAACGTYVTANLSPTSAQAAEVTAGCADYVMQRGK